MIRRLPTVLLSFAALLTWTSAPAAAQAPAPSAPTPSSPVPAAPANDAFASAAAILTTAGYPYVSGSLVGASAEGGEPSHGAVAAHHSVWYQWTPAVTETVEVSLCPSAPASIAFYTGSTLAGLTRVAGTGADTSCGAAKVAVTKGTTYRIAVDGATLTDVGTFSIYFDGLHRTANDTREGAWSLPSTGETTTTASNVGMTTQAGEPNHADVPGGHSVWFDMAVTEGVPVTLDLCDSAIDTALAVYTRSYGGYTEIASNDDAPTVCGPGKTGSFLRFTPVADGAVHIAVDGKSGATGSYTLLARANDTKAGAANVSSFGDTTTHTNRGARTDPGEDGNATWYSTWAEAGQRVLLDTCSTIPGTIDTIVTAYTDAYGGDVEIASNDDAAGCAGGGSQLDFRAPRDGGILFAVAGKNGATGPFRLRLQMRPVNDDFANAKDLTSYQSVPSENGTREAGEPDHGAPEIPSTVWYRLSGPAGESQTVRLCRYGGTGAVAAALYTGNAVNALTKVTSAAIAETTSGYASGCKLLAFTPSAGVTYSLAVASAPSNYVTLEAVSPPANDRFASATALNMYQTVNGDTTGASAEPGEPAHAGVAAKHSVWLRVDVTSGQTRRLAVNVCGYAPTKLRAAAYTGSSLTALTPVATTSSTTTIGCSAGTQLQWRAPQSDTTLTYWVAIDSPDDGTGYYYAYLSTTYGPSNDDRAQAQPLYSEASTTTGYMTGASLESNEPDHAGAGKTGSVWFSWTPTVDGAAQMDTCAPASSGQVQSASALAVYTESGSALVDVASSASAPGCGDGARVKFAATKGTTYYVAVASSDSASFQLRTRRVPPNDQWSGAQSLYDGASQALDLATAEPLDSTWLGTASTQTVWWSYRAYQSGRVLLDTCDTGYSLTIPDTVVAVVEDPSAGSGAQVVTSNDDAPGCGTDGRRSRVAFDAVAGKTYGVLVGSKGTGYGDVTLAVTPVNDNFASATVLRNDYFYESSTHRRATAEAGEPRHGGADAAHSLWYDWTPNRSGSAILDSCAYSGTRLGVYTGSTLSTLTPVAQQPSRSCPGGQTGPQVRFKATAGSSYKIAVDRTDGGYTYTTTRWAPDNDTLADAELVSGTAVRTLDANLRDATLEAGEPDHGGAEASIWYRWTPDEDVTGNVDTCSTTGSIGATVAVYTQAGTGLAGLRQVTDAKATAGCANGTQAAAHWRATKGTTYLIAIGAPLTLTDTVRVAIGRGPTNDDLDQASRLATYPSSGTTKRAGTEAEEATVAGGAGRTTWWSADLSDGTSATFSACPATPATDATPVIALYGGPASNATHSTLTATGTPYTENGCRKVDVVRGSGRFYLAVDAPAGGTAGDQYRVSYATAADNDAQASAGTLTAPVTGSVVAASAEPGEPARAGVPARRSVWYRWTAPAAGAASFEVCTDGFSAVLAAYTVSTGGALTEVTSTSSSTACTGGKLARITLTAAAATSYLLAVDVASGTPGSFELSPPPGNDAFAAARTIGSYVSDGRLGLATAEAGEPSHAGSPAVRSVWYSWTPARSSTATISTCLRSTAPTRLALYTGTALSALSTVASSGPVSGCAGGNGARIATRVIGGTTYRIAVDGAAGAGFDLTAVLAPENDDRAAAQSVTRGQTVYGTNSDATAESAEPAHAGQPATASVWFKYVADQSGTVAVKACQASFTPVLAVYTADGAGAASSADSTRRCSGNSSANAADVRFSAVAGTTYYVALDGKAGATGTFALAFGGPANDDIDNAAVVPSAGGSVSTSTAAATVEVGEPQDVYPSGRFSVWWKWTAPTTKTVEANTCSSGYSQTLDIFTKSGSTLTAAPTSSLGGCYGTRLSLAATAGTTYYLRLSAAYETTDARLQLAPPANDRFANAKALGSAPVDENGTLDGASSETFDPYLAGSTGRIIWYHWTASADGRATLDTCDSPSGVQLEVFTGAILSSLSRQYGTGTQRTCTGRRSITLPVTNGTTYRIAVYGTGAAPTTTNLKIRFVSDETPPETTISAGPTQPVATPPVFSLGSSETPSTFECSVDGGPWAACASSFRPSVTSDGPHTVEAVAIDDVGNRDQTPAQATFTLDSTAPPVVLDSGPTGTITATSATFRFSSTEAGATFVCSLDAGSYRTCESPLDLTSLEDGTHTFAVRAVDALGNRSAPQVRQFIVDAGLPETTITGSPAALTRETSLTLTFSSEPGATFRCTLDTGAEQDCQSPRTLTGLAEGAHTFAVYAIDAAGNRDPSPAEHRFTVDRTAPNTTITAPPSAAVHRSVTASFTSSETGGTFRCTIDGKYSRPCASGQAISLTDLGPGVSLTTGRHLLAVYATDGAGNEDQSPAEAPFTLANELPVVSLGVTPDRGVAALQVEVTVAATDGDGDAMSARIDFGDGTPIASATLPLSGPKTHTYEKAGSYLIRVVADDGFETASQTHEVEVGLAEPLSASAGDDLGTVAGDAVLLDGTGSRPQAGIGSYTWEFGDGQSGSGARVKHAYSAAGTYTAKLTVRSGTESQTDTVKVVVAPAPPAATGTTVTVKSAGANLVDADVLAILPDGRRVTAATASNGQAVLRGLPDGPLKVYASKGGYLPKAATVTVSGGVGAADITLEAGELAKATLTSRPLTRTEIIAAGIDPDDPDNQHVYEFDAVLPAFHLRGYASGKSWTAYMDGKKCLPLTCSNGRTTVVYRPGRVPVIQYLTLPGKASFLKEFFSVEMLVQNLADRDFSFVDGRASLALPKGLSLAPTAAPQSLTRALPDIPGGGQAATNWIVRGDTEGTYDLAATYRGRVTPIDEVVDVEARTAEPLKVWGGSALEMTVETDDAVTDRAPMRVRVGLKNVADVPVYNAAVTLDDSRAEGVILQPREQKTESTPAISPGTTWWTHDYVFVPHTAVDRRVDAVRAFVRQVGGDVSLESKVVTRPALKPLEITSKRRDGTVILEWEAAPGASDYRVYATPNADTPFGTTPVSTTTLAKAESGHMKVALKPASEDELYAVSPIIGGRAQMVHSMVDQGEDVTSRYPVVTDTTAPHDCRTLNGTSAITVTDPDFAIVASQYATEAGVTKSGVPADGAYRAPAGASDRPSSFGLPYAVPPTGLRLWVRTQTSGQPGGTWKTKELASYIRCRMISFGDSYTSGEGLTTEDGARYDCGTDMRKQLYYTDTDLPLSSSTITPVWSPQNCDTRTLSNARPADLTNRSPRTQEYVNLCHRASRAYPNQLREALGIAGPDFQFLACSGAVAENVGFVPDTEAQYPQSPVNVAGGKLQIDTVGESFSTAPPSLVTIGLGGNDAGFGKIIEKCIVGTCTETEWQEQTLLQIKGVVFLKLRKVFKGLRSKFPYAQVAAFGYPSIIGQPETKACAATGIVSGKADGNELIWLRDHLIPEINAAIKKAASQAGVTYLDITEATEGGELCSEGGGRLINGLRAGNDDFNLIARESFHPNQRGHDAIAEYVRKTYFPEGRLERPDPQPTPEEGGSTQPALYLGKLVTQPLTVSNCGASCELTISGTGFAPSSTINAVLHSDPVELGSLQASSSGEISGRLAIPASVPAGEHTLELTGRTPAGALQFAAIPVTVPERTAAGGGGSLPGDSGGSTPGNGSGSTPSDGGGSAPSDGGGSAGGSGGTSPGGGAGTPGGPSTPGGGGTPLGEQAPVISAVSVKPRSAVIGKARQTTKKLVVSFLASTASNVTLTVYLKAPGLKKGSKCVKPSRSLKKKKAKKCVLLKRFAATAPVAVTAGRGTLSISKMKVGRKRLRPGTYVLSLVGTAPGGSSGPPATATLKVTKKKRK